MIASACPEISDSSTRVMPGSSLGLSRKNTYQATAHRMLRAPTTRNDSRQPEIAMIAATAIGAAAVPRREAECTMPCTNPLRSIGTQRLIAWVAVGKVADSARPRRARARRRVTIPVARPVKMVAAPQRIPRISSALRGPSFSPSRPPPICSRR